LPQDSVHVLDLSRRADDHADYFPGQHLNPHNFCRFYLARYHQCFIYCSINSELTAFFNHGRSVLRSQRNLNSVPSSRIFLFCPQFNLCICLLGHTKQRHKISEKAFAICGCLAHDHRKTCPQSLRVVYLVQLIATIKNNSIVAL
jgi:hypothetical protein